MGTVSIFYHDLFNPRQSGLKLSLPAERSFKLELTSKSRWLLMSEQNPDNNKPKKQSILMYLFATVFLLSVVVGGYLMIIIILEAVPDMEQISNEAHIEAVEFSKTHDSSGCFREAMHKAEDCTELNKICSDKVHLFLRHCFENAPSDPNFCKDSIGIDISSTERSKERAEFCEQLTELQPELCKTLLVHKDNYCNKDSLE